MPPKPHQAALLPKEPRYAPAPVYGPDRQTVIGTITPGFGTNRNYIMTADGWMPFNPAVDQTSSAYGGGDNASGFYRPLARATSPPPLTGTYHSSHGGPVSNSFTHSASRNSMGPTMANGVPFSIGSSGVPSGQSEQSFPFAEIMGRYWGVEPIDNWGTRFKIHHRHSDGRKTSHTLLLSRGTVERAAVLSWLKGLGVTNEQVCDTLLGWIDQLREDHGISKMT